MRDSRRWVIWGDRFVRTQISEDVEDDSAENDPSVGFGSVTCTNKPEI